MSPPESRADPPADLPNGVSLEQYAGVTTALAEGHPLEAILSNEPIASDAWKPAEVAPDREQETLARYRISPAAKQAADKHYAERVAKDPSAREAWDHAYRLYRTWWRGGRVNR